MRDGHGTRTTHHATRLSCGFPRDFSKEVTDETQSVFVCAGSCGRSGRSAGGRQQSGQCAAGECSQTGRARGQSHLVATAGHPRRPRRALGHLRPGTPADGRLRRATRGGPSQWYRGALAHAGQRGLEPTGRGGYEATGTAQPHGDLRLSPPTHDRFRRLGRQRLPLRRLGAGPGAGEHTLVPTRARRRYAVRPRWPQRRLPRQRAPHGHLRRLFQPQYPGRDCLCLLRRRVGAEPVRHQRQMAGAHARQLSVSARRSPRTRRRL